LILAGHVRRDRRLSDGVVPHGGGDLTILSPNMAFTGRIRRDYRTFLNGAVLWDVMFLFSYFFQNIGANMVPCWHAVSAGLRQRF
jgi:hypothetical protein